MQYLLLLHLSRKIRSLSITIICNSLRVFKRVHIYIYIYIYIYICCRCAQINPQLRSPILASKLFLLVLRVKFSCLNDRKSLAQKSEADSSVGKRYLLVFFVFFFSNPTVITVQIVLNFLRLPSDRILKIMVHNTLYLLFLKATMQFACLQWRQAVLYFMRSATN